MLRPSDGVLSLGDRRRWLAGFEFGLCAQKSYAQLRDINELDLKARRLASGGIGFAECTAKALTGIRVSLNDGDAMDHGRTFVASVQGRQFDSAQNVTGLERPIRTTIRRRQWRSGPAATSPSS